jgi:hypothetical protein
LSILKQLTGHELYPHQIETFEALKKIRYPLLKVVIFTHDRHFLEIAKEFSKEGKSHWGVIFVSTNKLGNGECIKQRALYAEVLEADEMKNQIEFL